MQNKMTSKMVKKAISFIKTFFETLPDPDKNILPEVLRSDGSWVAAYESSVIGLFFIKNNRMEKVKKNLQRNLPLFPGLLLSPERRPQNAPIAVDAKGTCNYFESNRTTNIYAFIVQPGASFTIVNHLHEIKDAASGEIFKFHIDLGFVIGIRKKEKWSDISQRLNDLLNHTIDIWRKAQ